MEWIAIEDELPECEPASWITAFVLVATPRMDQQWHIARYHARAAYWETSTDILIAGVVTHWQVLGLPVEKPRGYMYACVPSYDR